MTVFLLASGHELHSVTAAKVQTFDLSGSNPALDAFGRCIAAMSAELMATDNERCGRLRVDRLLAEHGADAPVGMVLRALVGDCPRQDQRERERCDPCGPELAQLPAAG